MAESVCMKGVRLDCGYLIGARVRVRLGLGSG